MKEPKYVSQTLNWCNSQRKKKKKQPLKRLLKGYRFDAYTCPCGSATGLIVGTVVYSEREQVSYEDYPLPEPVIRFVQAFDSGLLPQYELKT